MQRGGVARATADAGADCRIRGVPAVTNHWITDMYGARDTDMCRPSVSPTRCVLARRVDQCGRRHGAHLPFDAGCEEGADAVPGCWHASIYSTERATHSATRSFRQLLKWSGLDAAQLDRIEYDVDPTNPAGGVVHGNDLPQAADARPQTGLTVDQHLARRAEPVPGHQPL